MHVELNKLRAHIKAHLTCFPVGKPTLQRNNDVFPALNTEG